MTTNVRLRVVDRSRLGRFRYEMEVSGDRRLTRTPGSGLEPVLGVGDAWVLIHAADAKWDGTAGEWVELNEDP